MVQAPVGYHCPQCLREGRLARRIKAVDGTLATKTLIGICVAIFGFEYVTGYDLSYDFGEIGVMVFMGEWYRLVTSMFLHGSLTHVAFNMLALWQLGSVLEPMLGRSRYLLLYFLSGLSGSFASLLFNDQYVTSIGASGAIFGLMGAYAVFARSRRPWDTSILVVIGLNLVIGFVVPGIDWHAHLGGLAMGAAFGAIYLGSHRY